MLMQKQQIEDAVWSNPAIKDFMDAEGTEPEMAADVIDLVRTFQQILERARSRPMLQVDEETVTVGQMIDYLQRRLALEDRPLRLKQILRNVNSRQALVCMFLALLEMVRLQAIQLRQDRLSAKSCCASMPVLTPLWRSRPRCGMTGDKQSSVSSHCSDRFDGTLT